ncbi:hypothetical protein [Butyrivibrio sp. WCD3002]|uniref:hypothetical protein n=1 Tax=Butyrivibrio sp. WCD3002 TaxID=1280676 RepID=UPI00047BA880|nr:hypothetical protein [Butyrivibrio sp. WCD3002]
MGKWFENKERLISIFGALVMLSLLIAVISNKVGYHIDEISSYTRANHTYGYVGEEGVCYTPANEPYIYLATATEGNRFNYIQVWKTAGEGVHPPIYYILLHTLCSITPGVYNMWYAGGINIFFAILTFFVFRMLLKVFVDDFKIRTVITAFYVTCYGMLSIASFFRMYIIAMFWVTLLSYFFVNSIGKEFDKSLAIKLFLTTVGGALTHYYCIVFAVFISVTYGVYLLINKRKADVGKFCLTMALAGGCSVVLFPRMIKHMFFEHRGEEAMENLSTISNYPERLTKFVGFINSSLFGKYMVVIFVGIAVLLLLGLTGIKKENKVADKDMIARYLMLICPTILYFLMVSKMASFVHERYIIPIYTISILWVICLLSASVNRFLNSKITAILLAVVLIVVSYNGYSNAKWTYLQLDDIEYLNALEAYNGSDCVCLYDKIHRKNRLFTAADYFGSITFVDENNTELMKTVAENQKNPVILVIYAENTDEILEKFKENSDFTNVEVIAEKSDKKMCYLY